MCAIVIERSGPDNVDASMPLRDPTANGLAGHLQNKVARNVGVGWQHQDSE